MPTSKYTVVLSTKAVESLESIYSYYFEQSKERSIANKVTDELEMSILNLEVFPKAHPLTKIVRLSKLGYRKLVSGNYIILYKIEEARKLVVVSGIFHGMTDYSKNI